MARLFGKVCVSDRSLFVDLRGYSDYLLLRFYLVLSWIQDKRKPTTTPIIADEIEMTASNVLDDRRAFLYSLKSNNTSEPRSVTWI